MDSRVASVLLGIEIPVVFFDSPSGTLGTSSSKNPRMA